MAEPTVEPGGDGSFEERESSTLGAELLLRPARSANVFEETMQRLLQSVRLGLIAPGERLPSERVLATMLGVSRDTLRDAIAALTDAGYLSSRRGRYGGTFVVDEVPAPEGAQARRSVPRDELDDTLVLRSILEIGAARQAAMNELSRSQRESLWQTLELCSAAAPADYRRHDSRLHLLIAELAGAPSLVPLVADVRMRVNELLDGIPLLTPNIAHSNQQHEAIVKAILRGNPAEAMTAMGEHIAGTEALLRGFLA